MEKAWVRPDIASQARITRPAPETARPFGPLMASQHDPLTVARSVNAIRQPSSVDAIVTAKGARESEGRSLVEAFEHTITYRAPNKPANLAATCSWGSDWESLPLTPR